MKVRGGEKFHPFDFNRTDDASLGGVYAQKLFDTMVFFVK